MAQCPGQDKRFWKPEDIFDINCPKCGAKVEFWKDDIDRRCGKCGYKFRNPKLDLGCAEWCQYAKYCLGRDINNDDPEPFLPSPARIPDNRVSLEQSGVGKSGSQVQGEKEGNMKTATKTKGKRQIIRIDADKCTGCGECIPNCPEGALQIIDDKARLISDLFCDGLGACIGHCPEGAISTEEREAEPYDERKVMANIVKHGENTIKAHLKHLKDHQQNGYLKQALDYLKEKKIKTPIWEEHKEERLPCGCPGTAIRSFSPKKEKVKGEAKPIGTIESQLTQWPVQLHLVPPNASFLKDRDLVISADCVSYSYGNFHNDFLKDKALVIACPKLDDTEHYLDKLTEIFKVSGVKSITILHMEVPCCLGLVNITKEALEASGRKIPAKEITIGIQGDILGESQIN